MFIKIKNQRSRNKIVMIPQTKLVVVVGGGVLWMESLCPSGCRHGFARSSFYFNYNIDFFLMKICIFFIHILKLCTCDFHKNWTFFLHSTNVFSGHKLNETSKWYLSKRDPVGVLSNSWTVQVWTYMYNYVFDWDVDWRQFVNISIIEIYHAPKWIHI